MRIIETSERGETSGGYRRDHLRALAQRVEVDTKEVRIMGSKSVLLRTLAAASSVKTGVFWSAGFCTEVARHPSRSRRKRSPKLFRLLSWR